MCASIKPDPSRVEKKQYDMPALSNAIKILELIGNADSPVGPSEVMARLGINKHMAFRILRTMEKMQWIVREPDEARYVMGLRPFHFVSRAVSRMDIVTAAEIPMTQLWREKGCLSLLCVLRGNRVMPIRKFEQRGDFRYTVEIGTLHYLHNSAPGKVILAWHEDELLDGIVREGLPKATEWTVTHPAQLAEQLVEIRHQGYALDRFECAEGLLCLAAPVFDFSGQCVGAISTSVLTAYYTEERLLAELRDPIMEAARQASVALGHVRYS